MDITKLEKKELEALVLAFTIQNDTMPATPQELREDLIKFIEYVKN